MAWLRLGARSPQELVRARLLSHHALQLGTRLARGYLEQRQDDSHTSFAWNAPLRALIGKPIHAPKQSFRFGLRLHDLACLLVDSDDMLIDIKMAGSRKLADLERWIVSQLRSFGLDPAPFHQKLHFEIPSDPVERGAVFVLDTERDALVELANWYSNAAELLESVRDREQGNQVLCWPHHFDLATLIEVGEGQTIGAGLSPGDANYPMPYFYVTPWPYPAGEALPDLRIGVWHQTDWTGAVLTGEALIASGEQEAAATEFLSDAIQACRRVIQPREPVEK
jgi:hypothetical protein